MAETLSVAQGILSHMVANSFDLRCPDIIGFLLAQSCGKGLSVVSDLCFCSDQRETSSPRVFGNPLLSVSPHASLHFPSTVTTCWTLPPGPMGLPHSDLWGGVERVSGDSCHKGNASHGGRNSPSRWSVETRQHMGARTRPGGIHGPWSTGSGASCHWPVGHAIILSPSRNCSHDGFAFGGPGLFVLEVVSVLEAVPCHRVKMLPYE